MVVGLGHLAKVAVENRGGGDFGEWVFFFYEFFCGGAGALAICGHFGFGSGEFWVGVRRRRQGSRLARH